MPAHRYRAKGSAARLESHSQSQARSQTVASKRLGSGPVRTFEYGYTAYEALATPSSTKFEATRSKFEGSKRGTTSNATCLLEGELKSSYYWDGTSSAKKLAAAKPSSKAVTVKSFEATTPLGALHELLSAFETTRSREYSCEEATSSSFKASSETAGASGYGFKSFEDKTSSARAAKQFEAQESGSKTATAKKFEFESAAWPASREDSQEIVRTVGTPNREFQTATATGPNLKEESSCTVPLWSTKGTGYKLECDREHGSAVETGYKLVSERKLDACLATPLMWST